VALEGESIEVTHEVASGVVLAPAHLLEDDELLTLERAFIETGVARDVGEQLQAGHGATRRQHGVIVRIIE
jgi:hypothetical protein